MRFTATILATGKDMYDCLKPDESTDKRHKTTIEKTETGVKITIEAEDAVAFRAIMTSITRQLSIAEKAEKLE